MSYRPKVKTNSSGTLADLAIDAASVNGFTVAKSVPSDAKFTDTTYESKAAASGGTAVSLVTTGEKYNWNNKVDSSVTSNNRTTSITRQSSNTGIELLAANDTIVTTGTNFSKIKLTQYGEILLDGNFSSTLRAYIDIYDDNGNPTIEVGYKNGSSVNNVFDLLALAPFASRSISTTAPSSTSTDYQIPTAKAVWGAIPSTTEVWTFTLADGTTVQKEIYIK